MGPNGRRIKFELTAEAKAVLCKWGNETANRIFQKLIFWEGTGMPLKYAAKIEEHPDLFRYRIGDWRLIAMLNHETGVIKILKIGHRSKVYKNLNK